MSGLAGLGCIGHVGGDPRSMRGYAGAAAETNGRRAGMGKPFRCTRGHGQVDRWKCLGRPFDECEGCAMLTVFLAAREVLDESLRPLPKAAKPKPKARVPKVAAKPAPVAVFAPAPKPEPVAKSVALATAEDVLAETLARLGREFGDKGGWIGLEFARGKYNVLAGEAGFVTLPISHFSMFLKHVGVVSRGKRVFGGKTVACFRWDEAERWIAGRKG